MLIIRLQRVGKKNQANFRLVLAEKQRAVKKQFVELLGNYDPHKKNLVLKNQDRLNYWIGQKVEITPTVHNLLVGKGLLSGAKVQSWKPKKKEKSAEAAPATEGAAPKAEAKGNA